jgi:UDP:flavonoid glycosyltransferase YjiC (YdhE family)
VLCGLGFCSPPRVSPFPSFRTWEEVPRERLERSDAQVLATMNWALEKLGLRHLGAAHEIFNIDDEFLCTFPELDHYGIRPDAPYCGPVFVRDEGAEPVWPEQGKKRVYVSLRPETRALAALGEMLSDSALSVLWVAPEITDKTARRYQDSRLRFVQGPVRLADAAAGADVAVLGGNHGTVSAMLLAGVPMALFPAHAEQALVAHNVVQLGAGAMAAAQAPTGEMRQALAAVLREDRFKEAAKSFAIRHAQHDSQKTVAKIARRITNYCETAKL